MTSYTVNRGYPYPSSNREAGNGGLHSELLARAVARDLDGIDAEWASLLQRPTIILSMPADQTSLSANGTYGIFYDTVDKQLGADIVAGSYSGVKAAVAGWYHVTVQQHTKANGTITATAMHRIGLEHVSLENGQFRSLETLYAETYQSGTLDIYNVLDAVFHLEAAEEVRVRYYHTNSASDTRAVASGSHLTAAQIVRD